MKTNLIFIIFLLTFFCQKTYSQPSQEEVLEKNQNALDSLKLQPQSQIRDSSITICLGKILLAHLGIKNSKLNAEERINPLKDFTEVSVFDQKEGYFYYYAGFNYRFEGLNEPAIEYFYKSLEIFIQNGNKSMEASTYNQLTRIVSLTLLNNPDYDPETRTKYYKYSNREAVNIENKKDTVMLSSYHLNIALQHLIKKEYEKAKINYRKSWEVVADKPERFWFQYYGGRWAEGLCMLHMGQTKKGFELINEVKREIAKSNTSDRENLRAIIGFLLGDYFIQKGNYIQGLKESDYGAKDNPILKAPIMNHFMNKNYYRIYKAMGNYQKALSYHEEIVAYNRELEKAEIKGNYVKWANREENIAKDNKINSLEVENLYQSNERQKLLRNFLILGLIALSGLAIYILYSNKELRSLNANLLQKNKEIEMALFKGQHLERKRVASELHDTLATKTSALKWRMEALTETLKTDKEPFENVVKSLEELYTDIRFISHNLLPEELEREGLKNTLTNLISKLNMLNKTTFNLVLDGLETKLETMIQYEFYNVILELCNNILKHSEAQNAFISVSDFGNKIYLTVTDDGVGIYHKKNAKGIGLSNIKNRIESIGGEIDIESGNAGTKVSIII
ncbi:Histidine kinase-, DNA gyrase B-, and HSP90-like ATPase [Spirosomataceae bacterium TFI 002]|nr:Histidine kinase-, DNA gyrase B-, and HSP90-like ATPase [Spirosomataceae bacterium TFI 002]